MGMKKGTERLLALVLSACTMLLCACGTGENSAEKRTTQSTTAETTEGAAEESTKGTEETREETTQENEETTEDILSSIDTSGLPHYDDPSDFPHLDGSTATLPLSYALYELCTGADEEEARNAITHTKTNQCYYDLTTSDGPTNTLILAYEPSQDVLNDLKSSGVDYEMTAIGRDALVFLENRSNPVKDLTGDEVVGIYSGSIRNWSELGGNNQAITAFQREQGSGSQALMDKLVMKDTPMMDAPSYQQISGMGELLDVVRSYDNSGSALGYSVYFYVSRMNDLPDLQLVSIDGVAPSNSTIQDGSYPYVNDFFAAIRSDETGDAKKICDWLQTKAGQELIQALGYVPVMKVDSSEVVPAEPLAEEVDSGSFDLGDNEALLLDRRQAYGEDDGVTILDGELKETGSIDHVTTTGGWLSVADTTEPQILYDTKTKGYGLYDLKEGTWLLDPPYDEIDEDEGRYLASSYDGTDGTQTFALYEDGSVTNYDPGDSVYLVGSHVFVCDTGDVITICDADGNKSGTIDLNSDGLTASYASEGIFHAWDGSSSEVLFDENGKKIADRSMLPDGVYDLLDGLTPENLGLSVYAVYPARHLVFGSVQNTDDWSSADFALDYENNTLLTEKGDSISGQNVAPDGHVYYTLTDADGARHVREDTDTQDLTSEEGTPYTYVLSCGETSYDGTVESSGGAFYLGFLDGDTFVADSMTHGDRVEMDLSGYPSDLADEMSCAGYGIFTASCYPDGYDAPGEGMVWKDGELYMSGEYAYNWATDGISVVATDQKEIVVDMESGGILFTMPEGLDVSIPGQEVILATGGNYLYAMNGSGEIIMEIMDPSMQQD